MLPLQISKAKMNGNGEVIFNVAKSCALIGQAANCITRGLARDAGSSFCFIPAIFQRQKLQRTVSIWQGTLSIRLRPNLRFGNAETGPCRSRCFQATNSLLDLTPCPRTAISGVLCQKYFMVVCKYSLTIRQRLAGQQLIKDVS